ncbi:t-SNARE [Ramicandelaber brevisporus]|nr:t-SNARE [Ramicandelaber brevisporus]
MNRDRLADLRSGNAGYQQYDQPPQYNQYQQYDQQQQQQQQQHNYYQSPQQQQQQQQQPGGLQLRQNMIPVGPAAEKPSSVAINVSGGGDGSGSSGDNSQFYSVIEQIRGDLQQVDYKIGTEIVGIERQMQSAFSESEKQQLGQQRDRIVSDIKHLLQTSKAAVQRLNEEAANDSSIDKRERKNRVNRCTQLMTSLKQLTDRFRRAEQTHRQWLEQQIVRQFRIVEPGMSEQEVKEVIHSGQAGNVFSQAVLRSNRMGEANRVLRDVQDRHRDLQQLEQTILQLAELFNEMSTMVNNQQEIINNIEAHVDDAVVNLQKGSEQLQGAIVSARAARKKRWWCFIITLILIVIVVILILKFVVNAF